LVEAGQTAPALALLAQIKGRRVSTRGADYLRALCFEQQQRPADALEAIKEELRYFPDHAEAAALLQKLSVGQLPRTLPADAEFRELFTVVRAYTMLSVERLFSLYTLAKEVCRRDLPGQFVECGVAGGGASALLAAVAARHSSRPRRVYACDTFQGMPVPGPDDFHEGQLAEAVGWSTGTCAAPVESLLEVCRKVGLERLVEPVRGLFAETLPVARERIGPIALLHADGDWYDSTRDVLNNLYDQVVDGGYLQIDDYGFWEGCRRAVEDFQTQRGVHLKINPIDSTGVWFNKPAPASTLAPARKGSAASGNGRLLNLGCGGHFHPEWVNVDFQPQTPGVIAHDLRTRLPFDDASFAVVYHSHVLEHLARREALPFLRECHRVLAPGGILRVAVPDLETIARLYLDSLTRALAGDAESKQRHEWMTIELLDQMVREQSGGEMLHYWRQNPMPIEEFVIQRCGSEVLRGLEALRKQKPTKGKLAYLQPPTSSQVAEFRASGEVHKWMYDRCSLSALLNQVGFQQLKVCAPEESLIPAFNSYSLDINADGTTRKPDSLFLEAVKT
jgi:predicted SAM-dependent methyltransferase